MNKALIVDLYELTMAQVYFKQKRNLEATFDLFIRSRNRPFYIACGIDEALKYLKFLKFNKEDIDYLRQLHLFEDDFLEYLKDFKFRGEVWAVEEPEIVFPQEPILRISGNLIEAQIVESVVLNKINLAVTLATKAARIVLASQGKGIYDFALRRTQGLDAALEIAKYSYMMGARGTSNVYAGFLYKIPVAGTMAHSFVMSFDREIESFLVFARSFPSKSILLIDTYNVKEGLSSAIKVAKFLKAKGINILGIRLDSANLLSDAKYARGKLNKEGLGRVGIFASGDLDEYKIEKLLKSGAPIDAFGVGTRMGCSSDRPYSDVIYKLVEIKQQGQKFIPTMKLSEGKTTLPSRKQTFRIFSPAGIMKKDYIGLDREALGGKKLLKKIMEGGRCLYKERKLEEKRKFFSKKIKKLPSQLKRAGSNYKFPVIISPELSSLTRKLKEQIKKRVSQKILFMDIDTQIDFITKSGALYVKGSEKIHKNLRKLTNFARRNNILIISSQDTHAKRDPEFKEFGSHCIKGTKGQKKLKETLLAKYKVLSFKKTYRFKELKTIVSRYPQIILEKNILDVFSNPNTRRLLEIIFPDKVYVYGVVTEYCVKKAVEGLLREGFLVAVIKDAIYEIQARQKQKLFSVWKKKGLEFVTTKSFK